MKSVQQECLQALLGQEFSPFAKRWRDNRSEPASRYSNWYVNGEHLGHLDTQHLPAILTAFDAAGIPLAECANGLALHTQAGQQEFSAALMSVGKMLEAQGLVPGWRHEEQLLLNGDDLVLATAERALFKTLGLRSRAVHVHVENSAGHIWTGVRARTKHENPGMLDNLAAGGVASHETIDSTLWRELDEEAGLKPGDFARIRPLAPGKLVLSRPLLYGGWHHETVFLFHGQLKPGHRPCNRDGEVDAFQLMSREACIQAINAWQFTPDAALCCALALSTTKQTKKD